MFGAIFAAVKGIVSVVFRVIWEILKLVYRVLKFLRIRLLTLYLVVMAILSLFLPVFGEKIVLFWVGFAVCLLITVIAWGAAIRKRLNARPRPAPEAGKEEKEEPAPSPEEKEREKPEKRKKQSYPRYFDVEGHPRYFFAEYEDRYELYCRGEDGAEYIRTDLKQRIP